MTDDSILSEAQELIDGPRAEAYGDAGENWRRTARIFRALSGVDLTPEQGLMFMVAVKLARHLHRPKRDNLVDACGYLALLARLEAARARAEEEESGGEEKVDGQA